MSSKNIINEKDIHSKNFVGTGNKETSDKNFVGTGNKEMSDKNLANQVGLIPSTRNQIIYSFLRSNLIDDPAEIRGKAINIVSWSDIDFRTKHLWADFWIKKDIERCLDSLGHTTGVLPELADITIYLWGSPMVRRGFRGFPFLYNPKSYNVCWAYSHPDRIAKTEMGYYDTVFLASEFAISKHKPTIDNIQNEPLLSCTSFVEPEETHYDEEIVFIGNARGNLPYGRRIIKMLDNNHNVSLWGNNWSKKEEFNPDWYKGSFIHNSKLPQLYKGSKICLNDHHKEHNEWGYVSFRIFDILASGGFCISDYNNGISGIFEDAVPTFKTETQLNKLIKMFLNEPEAKKEYIKKGQKIALEYKTMNVVKTILDAIGVKYADDKKLVSEVILEQNN